MAQSLYEINQDIQAVIARADEATGEIDADALNKLTMRKADKQLNIIKFIKHCENDEALVDKEIERLKLIKSSAQKRTEWLTGYLAQSMKIDEVTELDFVTFKAKFKRNPPRVEIDDSALIPAEFKKIKTEEVIDKTKIKEVLKVDPFGVPGALLVQEERLHIL